MVRVNITSATRAGLLKALDVGDARSIERICLAAAPSVCPRDLILTPLHENKELAQLALNRWKNDGYTLEIILSAILWIYYGHLDRAEYPPPVTGLFFERTNGCGISLIDAAIDTQSQIALQVCMDLNTQDSALLDDLNEFKAETAELIQSHCERAEIYKHVNKNIDDPERSRSRDRL